MEEKIEDLINDLVAKLWELQEPNFSKTDAKNAVDLLFFFGEKFKEFSEIEVPGREKLRAIDAYFYAKEPKIRALLASYEYDRDGRDEITSLIFKIFSDSTTQYVADTGIENFVLEDFLKVFRFNCLAQLGNHVTDPILRLELDQILDPSNDPEYTKDYKKTLMQILNQPDSRYNLSPEGKEIQVMEDYELFLKQCVWIVDSLLHRSMEDEKVKENLLKSLHKDPPPASANIEGMLTRWIESPAFQKMQDREFIVMGDQTDLKSILEYLKSSTEAHYASLFTIDLIHVISAQTGVAIDAELSDALDTASITQRNHLFLLFTIIRVVNKVHEDYSESIESLGDLALAKTVYPNLDSATFSSFVKGLNAIELELLKALDFKLSFKELTDPPSPSHRSRPH